MIVLGNRSWWIGIVAIQISVVDYLKHSTLYIGIEQTIHHFANNNFRYIFLKEKFGSSI